jgi:transcription elongation factor Elf1
MPIHHLHEPIDVFSEWLDDCEAAANPKEEGYQSDNDDDNDDLPASSGLQRQSKPTTQQQSEKRETYTNLGVEDSEDDEE